MLNQTLKKLFNRDLNKLKTEIESYQNEANLWIVDQSITNSAGNLCLHLIGNLNTYIGATLGGSGYIRNRELEFSLKDVPRYELIEKIDQTIEVVNQTLDKLTVEEIAAEYPMLVLEEKTSTEYFLVHLATHLAYHLGQINYHRRLLNVIKF
ncbi:DinB family protein [Pedobacter vanadiisoli]|uniref:DinB family protein n=1 Tax=Pedobacter vanadiisoli TaxID=1761975 RepID=A0ABW5MIM9_9SPHI